MTYPYCILYEIIIAFGNYNLKNFIQQRRHSMDFQHVTHEEYLEAAGNAVFRQLAEEPDLVIELDPELADFMGAYEEKALDGSTL